MTTHTPGPWINRHANQHGQIVIGSPNWTSAATADAMIRVECRRVHDDTLGVHVPAESVDEAEANARLIAAAPELLEALRECLGAFEALDDEERWPGLDNIEILARAAIARAQGAPTP